MKVVLNRPAEGTFVGVWEHNDGVWCDTFRWFDGVLNIYIQEDDEFRPYSFSTDNIKLFVIKE